MASLTQAAGRAASAPRQRSAAHRIALALVWLTIACGSVVLSEPAPVDVLGLGLILLLPVIGLAALTPATLGLLALMLVAAASAFIAAVNASEPSLALVHSAVTLYLYTSAFMFAAFIARRPSAHAHLILNAYMWAATVAGLAGIVAYFDLLPGANGAMTLYGRATGLFKDPNVYGPFLVLAIVYAVSRNVRGAARGPMLVLLPILGLAMLLSFSRGAWINLGIAFWVYGALQFVTARSNRGRLRILALAGACAITAAALVSVALQFDGIGELLAERAALTQNYDEGHEGRFGGQAKALQLALQYPLGIGAQQFAPLYHHEEPHNVYLAMFLNAGWLGGLIFLGLVGSTIVHGLRHALVQTATQPLFVVAYAAFVGHAVEGVLIDLDHWRHFYLLLALVWGLMLGGPREASTGGGGGMHSGMELPFTASARATPRR
jgi:hypothetical protein